MFIPLKLKTVKQMLTFLFSSYFRTILFKSYTYEANFREGRRIFLGGIFNNLHGSHWLMRFPKHFLPQKSGHGRHLGVLWSHCWKSWLKLWIWFRQGPSSKYILTCYFHKILRKKFENTYKFTLHKQCDKTQFLFHFYKIAD